MCTSPQRLLGALLLAALTGSLIALISQERLWLPLLAAGPRTYYVDPNGDDARTGHTPDQPLRSIQHALDLALPGEHIALAPGDYYQDAISRRDGAPGAPITISGPPTAVLRGAGSSRIVEINHDYHTLEGFSIDGQWDSADRPDSYRNKLLYVIGARPGDGVSNLRVLHMRFANAGDECLRLRYFAHNNEIAYSSFAGCGLRDFRFDGGGKNGEAIYIGTARGQIDDGTNPTAELDRSTQNWVHHNSFDTHGSECVNLKEGASENIVEYNDCTGQRDPESGGINAQGERNTIRYNQIHGNQGAGVRLGGELDTDGIDNTVYGNTITGNAMGGIKIERAPQGPICENQIADNGRSPVVGLREAAPDPRGRCP